MLEPLIAIVLGWALLGQSLTLIQGIGIVIVLAAVLASERARSRGLAVRRLGLEAGQHPVDVVLVVVPVRVDAEPADQRADVDADAAAALELGRGIVAGQRDHARPLRRIHRRQDVARPRSASPSSARVTSRSDCAKIVSMPTSISSSMPAVQAASAGSDGIPSS